MANFDTGKDILTNVLSRANELGIGLADRETEAKSYIQAAYISVLIEGYPWTFDRKNPPGILVTLPEITTGSVSATLNSTTITFTSAPTTSVKDYKFFVDTDPVIYRISAHTAASATATLNTNFLGATASGLSYHLFQDEYTLASDFLRPVNKKLFRSMDSMWFIELRSEAELDSMRRLLWSGTEWPRYTAFIAPNKVRLWPWPSKAKLFEYPYLYHPGVLPFDGSASDTLIIQPAEDRVVVALQAVGNLLLDKDEDRAKDFLEGAQAKISAMKNLQTAQTKAKIYIDSQFRVWR